MARKKRDTKAIKSNNKNASATSNRTYKDSLFTDLFYSDVTAEENLRSLYNALHPEDMLTKQDPIEDWNVKELRLSDAFEDKSNPFNLELKVTLMNIRAESNSDLLQRCDILYQYSKFVQAYEANRGSMDRMGDTIKYCVGHDILKEYIERKGKEVLSMLTMDWDYEEAMEVAREESGKKKEIEFLINFYQDGDSLQRLARVTGRTITEIQRILQENNIPITH